ncbi:nucleoid-structuring protein H-NS, partial [Halorubrum sp. Atlit-26R]
MTPAVRRRSRTTFAPFITARGRLPT